MADVDPFGVARSSLGYPSLYVLSPVPDSLSTLWRLDGPFVGRPMSHGDLWQLITSIGLDSTASQDNHRGRSTGRGKKRWGRRKIGCPAVADFAPLMFPSNHAIALLPTILNLSPPTVWLGPLLLPLISDRFSQVNHHVCSTASFRDSPASRRVRFEPHKAVLPLTDNSPSQEPDPTTNARAVPIYATTVWHPR